MPEHLHYDDDALVNVETHHEKSDVNVRALLTFLAVFVIFSILTHFFLLFMFRFFVRIANGQTNEPLTRIRRSADLDVPAAPRLQPFPNKNPEGNVIAPNANTPVTDMEEMRAAEEKAQTTYGWIDQQRGVVRLPIEQAKELLLQRGLPTTAGEAPLAQPSAPPSPSTAGAHP